MDDRNKIRTMTAAAIAVMILAGIVYYVMFMRPLPEFSLDQIASAGKAAAGIFS